MQTCKLTSRDHALRLICMNAPHTGRFTEIWVWVISIRHFWRVDFSFRWKLYFSPFWSASSGKFEEPHDFTSISQIRHDVGNRDGGGFFPSKATLEYPSSHSKFVKRAAACVVNIPSTVDNMRRARQDNAWFWRSSTFLSFFPSWKSWPRVLTVTKTWREGKDEEATF